MHTLETLTCNNTKKTVIEHSFSIVISFDAIAGMIGERFLTPASPTERLRKRQRKRTHRQMTLEVSFIILITFYIVQSLDIFLFIFN